MNKSTVLKKFPVGLMVILLILDVMVLVFEKIGAAAAGGDVEGFHLSFYLRLFQMPWVWIVIVLSPLQLWTWSTILSKTDLSIAYPVSSLCFPLTMIASAIIFGDHISPLAWLGGILIASGIALVGGEEEPDHEGPSAGLPAQSDSHMEESAEHSKDNTHESCALSGTTN